MLVNWAEARFHPVGSSLQRSTILKSRFTTPAFRQRSQKIAAKSALRTAFHDQRPTTIDHRPSIHTSRSTLHENKESGGHQSGARRSRRDSGESAFTGFGH